MGCPLLGLYVRTRYGQLHDQDLCGEDNEFFSYIMGHLGLLVLFGGVLSLLVFVSTRYQHTIRSATAEFILIGIPALYMATSFLIPWLLHGMGIENIRISVPWLNINGLPMEIGSILFGYELFLLVARIIQVKKAAKAS